MIRRRKILYFWRFILICQRWDRLRGQSCDYLSASRSLPSVREVWPSVIYLTVGFCCVALSPPLKGWSSRLWFYFGSADYSCYTLLHILYCHRSRALCCYSTEHFKLSDLKDNDLWKPNSSRETYEHVHHMKASTAAVHEYTLSPEPCSFSIPSPKHISFLVQFLNHWRILCTCEWICHNLPRLWQIYTRIKWKIGVKMATASQ